LPTLSKSNLNPEDTDASVPTGKVIPVVSLRKPIGIRKLIGRPRPMPNSFAKESSEEEQKLQQRKTESPKVLIKKVRTRNPGNGKILRKVEGETHASELVEVKPTEFPLKYSSRYRSELRQIPPTSVPTASVTVGSKEVPTPKRPFSSKPRRLVTKLAPKPPSSELPESVLLTPKDVLINRKPARRIPVGSVSERLKALKESMPSDSLQDERRKENPEAVTPAKREIFSTDSKNRINESRRIGMEKVKSTESEFDSGEMSEILGIPKPTPTTTTTTGSNLSKTLNSSPDYENESVEDDYDDEDYNYEPKGQKTGSDQVPFPESSSRRGYLSIPIVSIK